MIQYVELRLYDDLTSANYQILTQAKGLVFDRRRNDIGVINFDYPLDAAKALGLDQESARVGVALGFDNGTVKEVEQYLLAVTSDEKVVDEIRMLSVSGEDLKSVFKDAVIYPSNWPVAQPTGHEFIDNNIGTIMRTLILRAHNRGTITQVDETTFSGTLDSAGAAWDNVFSVNYSTGVDYWTVITDRTNVGLADVQMVGWQFKMYNGGSLGSHVGIDTLEVRPAKNVTEMVTTTDRSESYSTVLIEGDEGTALERHSSPAVGALGRRRETYLGQSGITADGVLAIIGDAYLQQVSTIPTEETVGLTDKTGADPFLEFDVNDWIWVRFEGSETAVERRIYQIAVSVDDDGNVGVGLTLNSIIAENLIRLQRKIDAYASGGTLGSIPDPGPGADTIKPNPVTSIVITSAAYEAQGSTQAALSVTWTDPTLNEDGTAFTDFDHYEVQWRYSTDPAFSGNGGNTYTAYSKPWGYNPVVPGSQVFVRVRVVDQKGNKSSWTTSTGHTVSNDNIAPAQPSKPITGARGGVVYVQWDGLDNGGSAMPVDFKDLQVHRSTTSGFTPTWDAATKCATFVGPDTVVFNDLGLQTTWYFKFLARDRAGNVSVASVQSNAQTVTPIVNTDLIGQIIQNANIADGTIVASDKVFSNSVVTANLQTLAVKAGYIDVNAVNAGNIQAGALTAYLVNGNVIVASASGLDSGTRVRMTSAGIQAYSGSSLYFDLTSGSLGVYGATIKSVNTSSGARAEMTGSGFAVYDSSSNVVFQATPSAVTVNGILRTDIPTNPRIALSNTSSSSKGVISFFYNGSDAGNVAAYIDNRADSLGNPTLRVSGGGTSSSFTNSSAAYLDLGGYGPSGNGATTLNSRGGTLNLQSVATVAFTANVVSFTGANSVTIGTGLSASAPSFTNGGSWIGGPSIGGATFTSGATVQGGLTISTGGIDMNNTTLNNVNSINGQGNSLSMSGQTITGGVTLQGSPSFGGTPNLLNATFRSGNQDLRVTSTGDFTTSTSSEKFKENIEPLTNLVNAAQIYAAEPVAYHFKNRKDWGDEKYGGVIAERMHELGLGIFVRYDNDGNPHGFDYDFFTAGLLLAIRDLHERLSELESAA